MKPKDPAKAQLIRQATLKLVALHGLASLTMASIGKEAGLGMGTLYVYFDSKEALVNTLYKELKVSNTARIYASISPNLSFEENLKNLFVDYLNNRYTYFEEHFFIDQCVKLPYLDAEARTLEEAAFTGVFELMDTGKALGIIPQLDNMFLTSYLMGGANEVVNLLRAQGQPLTDEHITELFTLSWLGLKR